jgi:hypothetical protein
MRDNDLISIRSLSRRPVSMLAVVYLDLVHAIASSFCETWYDQEEILHYLYPCKEVELKSFLQKDAAVLNSTYENLRFFSECLYGSHSLRDFSDHDDVVRHARGSLLLCLTHLGIANFTH